MTPRSGDPDAVFESGFFDFSPDDLAGAALAWLRTPSDFSTDHSNGDKVMIDS